VPAHSGLRLGCHLLNLLPENEIAVPQKPKHTMLPVLTVLFLVSYGLMAMLVVEQGKTIDNQRNLILQLFEDSNRLSALHANAAAQQHLQNPASKAPAAPSAAPSHKAGTLHRAAPLKPPKDTSSDTADVRRSSLTI